MSTHKPVVLSGIQTSGSLNIGHYLGAIKPWINLQPTHDCWFGLMDLHAITVPQDPKTLKTRALEMVALYIACGLDLNQAKIFMQSHVPGHTQLAWLLNCQASMGELNRMTQFKDKSEGQSSVSVGLFDYPVLMAADILLYQADLIPVGNDQKQHVELTRDLAIRFNQRFGDCFKIPEFSTPEMGSRLMSLQDPLKKMSKSDPNEGACLFLLDDPKVLIKKIKRAVTDSDSTIKSDEDKPGVTNLLKLYSALEGVSIEILETRYAGEGYGKFKGDLADLVVATLEPIQTRYQSLRADEAGLLQILSDGAAQARERTQPTLDAAYRALGFLDIR